LAQATEQQRGVPGDPPISAAGTTHVSAVDADGMVAALTSSNGVTAGFVIPGTGIQLNNMLGEADLNPGGFHATPPGVRMGSMMSPSILVRPDGCVVGLGTGGSERIRSALTEVMARMIDLEEPLDTAIGAGRIHSSEDGLQVEPLFSPEILEALAGAGLGPVNVRAAPDVYFGGVNAVEMFSDGSVLAVADGRRGGCAMIA
jgi:gamma-glutamyltranspeptidase/glutathione hydrolase